MTTSASTSTTALSPLKQAINNFTWIGKVGGIYTGIVALITDVLRPLGQISLYLAIALFIISATQLAAYIILKKRYNSVNTLIADKSKGIWFYTIFLASVLGSCILLAAYIFNKDKPNGILAEKSITIQKLQEDLGIIKKDLHDIKMHTENISKKTDKIETNTSQIKDSAKSIDNKMTVMINKVGKQGGIISDPQTAEDFYHNARIYEINGDYGNARKAYIRYFSFSDNKLDPHIRFQSFLKIQEGAPGAREIYNEMFMNSSNLIDQYALILLSQTSEKRNLLIDFEKKNSNFGPVYYELAKSFSKAALGEQGLNDKQKEKEYIGKFLSAYEKGTVTRYFIAKEELDKWLTYAREREKELEKLDDSVFKDRLEMSKVYNGITWKLDVKIKEKASEIFYKIDDGEFRSTGFYEFIDTSTGKKLPKQTIILQPSETPKQYVTFIYKDIKGEDVGPFRFDWVTKTNSGKKLDPVAESAINFIKLQPTWVQFDDRPDYEKNILFTFGPFGAGIEKVVYGLDKDTPDTEMKNITPFSFIQPNKVVSKISVQIYFKDGTNTDVRIFERTKNNYPNIFGNMMPGL